MNEPILPVIPPPGATGPQVCSIIRFYLPILSDLPSQQAEMILLHCKNCKECAAELVLLQQTDRQLASLPTSGPSSQVDQALFAALATSRQTGMLSRDSYRSRRQEQLLTPRRTGILAAAALLLILIGLVGRSLLWPDNATKAFQLPANLSWDGYALHYTQEGVDAQGKHYQIEVYQDLQTNSMHVESTMPGYFDVVVVSDNQTMLGKDMMHRVAQMGESVADWSVDGSMFDLTTLRHDLNAHRYTYLGTTTYQDQQVYILETAQKQALLLNMHYLPINVLNNYTGPGTGTPAYQTFTLMPAAEVSDAMWDMQIPSDFHMGSLPDKA